jgi:ADP-ribose pyrophosphatase YjhB (NUDIX family)
MDGDRVARPFSHCSACGSRFGSRARWPRTCRACGHVAYRNPVPVVVLVVPVEGAGVLTVRRREPPAGLALPSGYIEYGEAWQDAAVRELEEETGVRVAASTVRELAVRSGGDGTLLVFATAPAIARHDLRRFTASAEVAELVVVRGPRDDLVFPLDAEVIGMLRSGRPCGATADDHKPERPTF